MLAENISNIQSFSGGWYIMHYTFTNSKIAVWTKSFSFQEF